MNRFRFLKPFAIEVIAECLCGIKLEDARNPDNTFVKSMRAAIWEDITLDWTYNISGTYCEFAHPVGICLN
jgi:hypothetical protein